MKRTMRHNDVTRGAVLIEALIACAVLGISAAALANMISNVNQAARATQFQNAALEAMSAIEAQFRDSRCEYNSQTLLPPGPADFDLGLQGVGLWVPATWGLGGVLGSAITAVDLRQTTPRVQVAYQVQPPAADAAFQNPAGPTGIDIIVEIQDVDGANSVAGAPWQPGTFFGGANPGSRSWIKQFPLKKQCNSRLDTANVTQNALQSIGRGQYP
jgi:type II secretory pathway pseudopilin PulG